MCCLTTEIVLRYVKLELCKVWTKATDKHLALLETDLVPHQLRPRCKRAFALFWWCSLHRKHTFLVYFLWWHQKIIDNYHVTWPRPVLSGQLRKFNFCFFLRFELHNHDISTFGPFQPGAFSGVQQRRSNFLDLPAPLPAPIVSPESLIQFRRLRGFAKQLLWDRCFQQLPNSIIRARVDLHIASKVTCSLDKSCFRWEQCKCKKKTETFRNHNRSTLSHCE